ncbi:MAG: hypothetical protein IJ309_04840 [Clostridia bacterium]|nr:hypothetical protein [Clostridia bacterium]
MKKVLTTIACVFLLACLLALSILAQDVTGQEKNQETGEGVSDFDTESWDVKDYLIEKIAPVLVGVLTGACALITTLGSIKKSLSSLKNTKEELRGEGEKSRELFLEQSNQLIACSSKMEDTSQHLEELKEKIEVLEKELYYLSEQSMSLAKIITIGFLGDEKRVGSGRGEKMMLLLENSQAMLEQISKKIKDLKASEVE